MSRNEPIESLDDLRRAEWNEADAVARVGRRLASAAPGRRGRGAPRRHLLAAGILGAMVLGTAAAATAILVQRARLYDVTITENGTILSAPRLIVAPGQTATLTVEEADGSRIHVSIDENGEAVVEAGEGQDVHVEVTEIEPTQPSRQQLYRMTVSLDDAILAKPSVILNRGEGARVEIEHERGLIAVQIDERGDVHTDGIEGLVVEYEVIDLP